MRVTRVPADELAMEPSSASTQPLSKSTSHHHHRHSTPPATTTARLYAVYPTRPPISKRGEVLHGGKRGASGGRGGPRESESTSGDASTFRLGLATFNVQEHALYTPPTCYICPPCLALTNHMPCATAHAGVLVSGPDALVAGPVGPEIPGTICPFNTVRVHEL
jgi:hypothetical protein